MDGSELFAKYSHIPHTLIFDPPWEKSMEFKFNHSSNILAFCDGFRAGDIVRLFGAPTWVFAWDCVSSWYTPNRHLRRMKMCFWYGDITKYNQKKYIFGDPCGKPRLVTNTRGKYLFVPDTGKMLSDVFSYPITKKHYDEVSHSHAKPFDWMCALIANTHREGDIILDPFAGGGSSLAVARYLNQRWIGSEIDDNVAALIDERAIPPIIKKQLQYDFVDLFDA